MDDILAPVCSPEWTISHALHMGHRSYSRLLLQPSWVACFATFKPFTWLMQACPCSHPDCCRHCGWHHGHLGWASRAAPHPDVCAAQRSEGEGLQIQVVPAQRPGNGSLRPRPESLLVDAHAWCCMLYIAYRHEYCKCRLTKCTAWLTCCMQCITSDALLALAPCDASTKDLECFTRVAQLALHMPPTLPPTPALASRPIACQHLAMLTAGSGTCHKCCAVHCKPTSGHLLPHWRAGDEVHSDLHICMCGLPVRTHGGRSDCPPSLAAHVLMVPDGHAAGVNTDAVCLWHSRHPERGMRTISTQNANSYCFAGPIGLFRWEVCLCN